MFRKLFLLARRRRRFFPAIDILFFHVFGAYGARLKKKQNKHRVAGANFVFINAPRRRRRSYFFINAPIFSNENRRLRRATCFTNLVALVSKKLFGACGAAGANILNIVRACGGPGCLEKCVS